MFKYRFPFWKAMLILMFAVFVGFFVAIGKITYDGARTKEGKNCASKGGVIVVERETYTATCRYPTTTTTTTTFPALTPFGNRKSSSQMPLECPLRRVGAVAHTDSLYTLIDRQTTNYSPCFIDCSEGCNIFRKTSLPSIEWTTMLCYSEFTTTITTTIIRTTNTDPARNQRLWNLNSNPLEELSFRSSHMWLAVI